jgi:amino acid adenylation domain-containing protein
MQGLKDLSSRDGATPYTALLAAFAMVLGEHSGREDMIIGCPVTARDRLELEDLIGFFVHTLPLRLTLSGDLTFHDLLRQVRQVALGGLAHRELPLLNLVEALRPTRDLRYPTLIQATFQMRNFPVHSGQMPELRIEDIGLEPISARYDLSLEVTETAEGLLCWLGFNAGLFEGSTIEGMLARFESVLRSVVAEPQARLGRVTRLPGPSVAGRGPGVSPPPLPAGLYERSNLTMNQLLFWTGQKLRPTLPLYNIPFAFTIDAALVPEHFRHAFQSLVDRSDALRTVVEEVDGVPRQRVIERLPFEVGWQDFTHEAEPEAAARAWGLERACQRFDLSRRLFDCALLKLSDSRWVWFLSLHHLIADMASVALVFRHVQQLYACSLRGTPEPDIVPASHARLVDLEREQRLSGRYREAEGHWERKLAEVVEPLRFYGKPPPRMATRVRRVPWKLGPDRTRRLKELASREGFGPRSETAALLNLLAASLCGYLYRVTGNRRLSLGVPFHSRRSPEDRAAIGLLMQDLPLRVTIEEGETFRTLARKVAAEAAASLKHRPCTVGNPIHARAYEVGLNVHAVTFPDFLGSPVVAEWIHTGHAENSLTLQVHDYDRSGDLGLDFDFNCAVFSEEQQPLAVAHFQNLLDAFLRDPDQAVDAAEILAPEEKRRLLAVFNQTKGDFSSDSDMSRLLLAQMEKTPDALAVIDGDQSLTYGQLRARVDGLAARLASQGVGPDQTVGLCVERSAEMLVGLLAILRAGGAYLPLDPEYPRERLRLMLEDSRARVVLADGRSHARLPAGGFELVRLDEALDPKSIKTGTGFPSHAGPDNLAYLLYTSGSTGRPKGVLVEHRSLVNLSQWAAREFGLGPGDRMLQFASLSWDTSVEEIFPALLSGATLVLRPAAMLDSARSFLGYCQDLSVTVLDLPTAYFDELADAVSREGLDVPECLRLLIIGGERASPERVRLWLRHAGRRVRLVNTYGATEATAVSTMGDLSHPSDRKELDQGVPIGRPIRNVRVYIVDRDLRPVPIGVPGELCIGGVGVARGYLNQPDLARDRFVPDPFAEAPGARLFRTGDLARYLWDGRLVDLGRTDDQVKIRGYRIEPGEIEARLRQHPAIEAAAVIAREGEEGDGSPAGAERRLVAYIVPRPGQETALDDAGLRGFLREAIPNFMLPSAVVRLQGLPRTPSGKLDRGALPAPPSADVVRGSTALAPRDALELELAAIWESTIGIRPIGVRDDFFDLGGNSMLAVRLFSAMDRALGLKLPLAALFEAPTIEGLAGLVRQGGWRPQHTSLVPIQVGGTGPPLFCVHWLGGNVLVYRQLALHLGPEQPVYGLQAVGLDGRERPHTSIEDMAAHYVGEMLSLQPSGPYYLGGASLGGKVAFEMAQQLRARCEQVALVALFDTVGDVDLPAVPIGERVRLHTARLRDLSRGKQAAYLLSRIRFRARRAAVGFLIRLGWPLPPFLWNLKETTYRAAVNYRPRPYPGKVTLFRAREGRPVGKEDIFLGWDRVAGGGMEVHEIPGDHVSLMKEPGVRLLAEELKRCLSRGAEPR